MTLEDFRKKEKGIYVRERRSVFSFNCSNVSAWVLSTVFAAFVGAVGWSGSIAVDSVKAGIQRADEVLRDAEKIKEWQKAQIEANIRQNERLTNLEQWRLTEVAPKLWQENCARSKCDKLQSEVDRIERHIEKEHQQ